MSIEEVSIPVPGPNEVLIRVAACGLCHSDLTILHGAPLVNKLPIILGHEPAGIVAEVGSGMTRGKSSKVPRKLDWSVAAANIQPCISSHKSINNQSPALPMISKKVRG